MSFRQIPIAFALFLFLAPQIGKAQLQVTASTDAAALAQELVGPGVVVSNAVLNCGGNASGFFESINTPLGIDSGIFLGSGTIFGAVGPNNTGGFSTQTGSPGDPDLNALISPFVTFDACVLEFDVQPFGDTLKFDYVFGSEEYDEYVCSQFNDVFAFFISGPNPQGGSYNKKNVALIPNSNLAVTINSVNNGTPGSNGSPGGCTSLAYSKYYQSNAGSATLQYDGQTVVMSARLSVIPCNSYRLALKIADAEDRLYDSGVFLRSGSLTSNGTEVDVASNSNAYPDLVEGCLPGYMTLTRSSSVGLQLVRLAYGGSATRGIDYSNLPDSIYFQNGFNTVTFPITPYLDTLPEYVEDLIIYIINPCTGQPMDSATIMIYDSIQIESKPDTTVCMGDTIYLWAKDANNYYWDSDPDIVAQNFDSITVVPSRTHTFRVESTIGVCSDFDNIKVTVVPYPWVDAGPDRDVCLGTVLQLPLSDSSLQNPSYKWAPDSALAQTVLRNPYTVPLRTTQYFVTVTNEGICSVTDSMTIRVHNLPMVYAGPDQRSCFGDSVSFSATANRGGIYHWSPPLGLSDTLGPVIQASPPATTQYTLTFTDSFGCSSSDQVLLRIDPLPNVKIAASQSGNICLEDTIFLQASGAVSYRWEPAAQINDPDSFRTFAVPDSSLSIYLYGTDANLCRNADSLTVNVLPIPYPAILSSKDSLCLGESLTLHAQGEGTYSWESSSGIQVTGADSITIQPGSNVTYTLTVTHPSGCVKQFVKDIAVLPLPPVQAGPDTTICESSLASLRASGAMQYEWAPAAGLSCSNCPDPLWLGDSTRTFTVTGYNIYGCKASDELRVAVIPLPNLTVSPDSGEVCRGASLPLSASGGVSYQWQPAGLVNDASLANPTASPDSSVIFTVYIQDAQGCEAMKMIPVKVNPLPLVDAGPDDSLCYGESLMLTATGAVQYTWSPATGLSDPNIANPQAGPLQSITYTIQGTDANGCTNTGLKHLEVLPLPVAEAGPPQSICENERIQLQASGGVQYHWTPSLGLSCSYCRSPELKAVQSTSYSVEVSDIHGCRSTDSVFITVLPAPDVDAGTDQFICHYDSARLQASGGSTYYWSPPEGLSDPRIANPVAHPDTSRYYYVETTGSNGCKGIDSVAVIYFPVTQVLARGDTVICALSSTIIEAEGVSSYSWAPASLLDNPSSNRPLAHPDSTTLFTVTGTDDNGCISLDSVRVAINPLPQISLSLADTGICKNTSIQVSAGNAFRYEWKPPAGISNTGIPNPRFSPDDSTIYTVIAYTSEGCSDSQTVEINVFPPSDPAPYPQDASICPGDSILLTAQNGVSYIWTGDPDITDNTNDSIWVAPDYSTDYVVTISDSFNCRFSDTVQIEVYVHPVADAGEDQRVFYGESSMLHGFGNGTPRWSPLRWLSDPDIYTPDIKPDSSIYYILTVLTDDGCRASDTVYIKVYYETLLYMASAFTPNGDGRNDLIGPIWYNEFELENFSIYNRWGDLMFRTSDPNEKWDGRWRGVIQPVGTYVYIIEGYGNRGERFYKQGNFTLIR